MISARSLRTLAACGLFAAFVAACASSPAPTSASPADACRVRRTDDLKTYGEPYEMLVRNLADKKIPGDLLNRIFRCETSRSAAEGYDQAALSAGARESVRLLSSYGRPIRDTAVVDLNGRYEYYSLPKIQTFAILHLPAHHELYVRFDEWNAITSGAEFFLDAESIKKIRPALRMLCTELEDAVVAGNRSVELLRKIRENHPAAFRQLPEDSTTYVWLRDMYGRYTRMNREFRRRGCRDVARNPEEILVSFDESERELRYLLEE